MRHCICWLTLAACGRVGFDVLVPRGDAAGDAIGDGSAVTRCAGLAATCGPNGAADCCGNSLVTGGSVYRSFDYGSDNAWTDMSYPATVSDFRLDTYEVTVGRFREFVNAGLGTQANPPAAGTGARTLNGMAGQAGWDPTWNASLEADSATLIATVKCAAGFFSWTDSPGANEDLPMNCIDWFEAFAFCAWDGGYLPTEAEWEYAAAAGTEGRPYPWSNPATSIAIDCSHANYNPGTACATPPNGGVNRVGSESPAGDSVWGQADMAGNVDEWTLDWVSSYPLPCSDCADLTDVGVRGFHGGSFYEGAPAVRSATRGTNMPSFRNLAIGVRCARAP